MRPTLGIVPYFVSACLSRGADAGAIVGIVLLANRVSPHTAAAGLLAACLTAPHLAGPIAARILDRTRRKQLLLAAAFLLYAASIAGAALLLEHHTFLAAAALTVLAGLCGPLLTGGLSSVLGALVADNELSQRRAQGMDAFTYGVAATCGPALIAIVAAAFGPTQAVFAAAALAAGGGLVALALPTGVGSVVGTTEPIPTVRSTIGVLLRTGTLRRVAVGTALSALPVGAVSLLAIAFALDHHGSAVQGAILVTVDGVGSLIGSTVAIVWPLRGNPDRLIRWWTLAVAAGFGLCALSPTAPIAAVAFGATGAATSLQFAANLAARAAFSPPAARAQIFVTMAGLKTAFSSVGVALVGLATGLGSTELLVAAVVAVLLGLLYMLVDGARSARVSPSQSR
ncbi:MAG TPA: MFS transporter [Galbitalea sp.]|jgi:MFS family permease